MYYFIMYLKLLNKNRNNNKEDQLLKQNKIEITIKSPQKTPKQIIK